MFRDRTHAGRLLAEELLGTYSDASDAVVYGIPRGGVIVAAEVASRLGLPLDVVVASKIGATGNPEYAIGAIDADGAVTQNVYAGYSVAELEVLGRSAREKVAASLEMYRPGPPMGDLKGVTAIVVDDGIATGLTAFAAIDYLKRHGAARIVLATPVISGDVARSLHAGEDGLVALKEPELFYAVGQYYRHFDSVSDAEVLAALRDSRHEAG